MTEIHQKISKVQKPSSKTSSPEVSEPLSKKSVKSKAISSEKVKSEAHPVEEEVSVVEEFMEYMDELQNKIRSASSASEEEINNKTLHCLTTIENYIESHISQDSEKLDDLKLKDDMKAILKENNSYDIAQCLKIMDRKIAKDNKTEAQLSYTVRRYISKVLNDASSLRQIGEASSSDQVGDGEASSPRQIGRIWA